MPTITLTKIDKPNPAERVTWVVTARHTGTGDLAGEDTLVCPCGQELLISVTAADLKRLAFKCARFGQFPGCGEYLIVPP